MEYNDALAVQYLGLALSTISVMSQVQVMDFTQICKIDARLLKLTCVGFYDLTQVCWPTANTWHFYRQHLILYQTTFALTLLASVQVGHALS